MSGLSSCAEQAANRTLQVCGNQQVQAQQQLNSDITDMAGHFAWMHDALAWHHGQHRDNACTRAHCALQISGIVPDNSLAR